MVGHGGSAGQTGAESTGQYWGMRPYELRGSRVLLSVPTRDDIDRITQLCQDEQIQRWMSVPSPYQRRDAYVFVGEIVPAGWDSGRELAWAVREPLDRTVLGMVSVAPDGHGSAEIGFWLAAEARGSGLMAEAVQLVVENAFDPRGLALERLLWRAQVGNWPSRRVAWRSGFRFDGTVRSELAQRGQRHDAWVATLLSTDKREPLLPWFDVPTLHGNGIVLRRWQNSDADAVVEACNDPVTRHWLGGLPDPYTHDTALAYIADRERYHATARGVHWAAAVDEAGPAVGSFSLIAPTGGDSPIRHTAEVGYWVSPSARGRGVATEAVRLIVRHAFIATADGGLGLRRLLLAHADGNEASRAVAVRNGFVHTGVERSAERLGDGTRVGLHWYDLLPTDPLSLPTFVAPEVDG
jgi:RimJ/RimL family protein N-acetyltransferase